MYGTQIEMKGPTAIGTSDEDGNGSTLTAVHPDGGLKSVCTHRPRVSAFRFPHPDHSGGMGARGGRAGDRQGRWEISGEIWATSRPAPNETGFVKPDKV